MDDLVQRLSTGNHPVIASRAASAAELKQSLERKFVLIKFTDTQGGTELGVRLDEAASNVSQADFTTPTGTVHIVGDLTLNYVKVRCVADIDLGTLQGQGRLEVLQ